MPTISSAPFTLQNPAGDTIDVYVQNRSWTKCTITASSVYGATIVEYRLTIGDVTYLSSTNLITTDVLAQYGVLSGTVTVVDSRGQMATYTNAAAVTVYQYFTPIITAFSVMRCTSDGVVSNTGTYIKYVLTVSFAPINNLNVKAGTLKFKLAGGSYGSQVAMSAIPTYSATVTGVIGAGAITSAAYVVSASLTDKYSTTTVEADLASSKIRFDLHSSGEGMAIGKPADTASLFDVGIPSRFGGAVSFEEAPTFTDLAAVRTNLGATLANLGVRVGTYELTRSTWAADTNYTYTVTFDAPLPAAPSVVLLGWPRTASSLDSYSLGSTNLTTIGFTLNISRNAARSTATTLQVQYIAI